MKRNQVLVLVAAVVVAAVGWKLAAKEPRQEVAPLWWFDEPGFIVVEGGPQETVTVQNPRAADGFVFYVTAVLGKGCGANVFVYYPPEMQFPGAGWAWQPGSVNSTAGMLLPVVTTIDVEFPDAVGVGCMVLSGHYSLQQPHMTWVGP